MKNRKGKYRPRIAGLTHLFPGNFNYIPGLRAPRPKVIGNAYFGLPLSLRELIMLRDGKPIPRYRN